ncbi:MAG: PH domain-containing protein [Anaerolineae bacterium]
MKDAQVFRPSEKLVVSMATRILLVFVFFILPFALLALIPDMPPSYLWIFFLANAVWLIPALLVVRPYCQSISYELHDDELVVRRGIITHSVDTVPYAMITNTVVKRGPLDRWLGMGSLHVHTAGYSQQQGAEAKLAGLIEYDQVHEAILRAVHRLHGRRAEVIAEEERAVQPEADSIGLLQEILTELRAVRSRLERS